MSTPQLSIRLHNGQKIVLNVSSAGKQFSNLQMGELLCLPMESGAADMDVELVSSGKMPACRHTMTKTKLTEIAFAEDWSHVLIEVCRREPRHPNYYRNYVWQMSLIWGSMNAILHGGKALLVHCALLETERGAVVLFGESGIGKSTASARWRAQGGKCVSDDMALLDFSGEDQVYVRRMPTWSACREGKNQWNYPAGEELPLACVLALGRSESGRDEIVELSPALYFAQCYRSMFFWYLINTKQLPDELKGRLSERIVHFTQIITGKYPPRALLTVLEGDLRSVIENELHMK